MDNGLALFDDQTRYTLAINDSRVRSDVLNLHGCEALSVLSRWRVEFTTSQDDVTGEEVLLKNATLNMLSGWVVQGIITAFEWLGRDKTYTRKIKRTHHTGPAS